MSPLLFNIYSEAIFREALVEDMGDFQVNGVRITNIRYADDTVILADDKSDLQKMMDQITQHSERFGLHT